MPTEHFIPLRKADLATRLCQSPELSPTEQVALRRMFDRLGATLHGEYYRRLESLKNAYAPFDPDADTTTVPEMLPAANEETMDVLFTQFESLAERANFRALTLQDIHNALSSCSQWGLNLEVDIASFDRLEIFARGAIMGKRSRRRLRNWMRLEWVEVPIYQRLIVMFRLRGSKRFRRYIDTEDVFIKLFKDIPQLDLDMLLPAAGVRMSIVDRAKIILPTVSGVLLALWKIIQGALFAAVLGVYGFLALIGGTIGYGVRSFYGYLNTKNKYQLNLTESLYYQNLDNNAGVFSRLLDEAEEQENCEAILAYFFLWKRAPASGWNSEELDSAVEEYLAPLVGRPIDFEVGDALQKLVRLNLVEVADERYRAVPIDIAHARLRGGAAELLDLLSGNQ